MAKIIVYGDVDQRAVDQLVRCADSGNHYVDLFVDENQFIWIGVHFGSRGFGHKTASGFLAMAQEAYKDNAYNYHRANKAEIERDELELRIENLNDLIECRRQEIAQ